MILPMLSIALKSRFGLFESTGGRRRVIWQRHPRHVAGWLLLFVDDDFVRQEGVSTRYIDLVADGQFRGIAAEVQQRGR